MKIFRVSALVVGSLLMIAPAFAQTGQTAQKQKTQDGGSPPMVGPASGASKQKTDGAGPPMVGPASGAYKQKTQSLAHEAPTTKSNQN